ncbi:MAG: hypothetical protein JEZ14_07555 [Marinilabiliaceae bacterium]|nr:hypothetical protein [Marinilabiliaceae bacterium]
MPTSQFQRIPVFEHQSLKVGDTYDKIIFTAKHHEALEKFHGKGVPYFNLIHKGVKFNEFVGVLQVGNLIIEVLPKADRYRKKDQWRKILIGMLKAVGAFDIKAPTSSALSLKSNFILDLYFELFIKEVEYLLHKGLIKKYRKTEGNSTALKGALHFGKHLQKNLVHQERFFVKYTTYDQQHLIHQIIYKTLKLIQQINSNAQLNSKLGALSLNFPEMPDFNVAEATFEKIVFNRKNKGYQNAIEIARLLLLNYHPDVSKGQKDVLSLMFDMNKLWEKFIYVSLRKYGRGHLWVKEQSSKKFWHSESGRNSTMRPDILVSTIKKHPEEKVKHFILDTKWKNLGGSVPSPDHLRQLYVYHQYFNAQKVALVYPGKSTVCSGKYYETSGVNLSDKECSVLSIEPDETMITWQRTIADELILEWMEIKLDQVV